MDNSLERCSAWADLEAEHRDWLSAFDGQHLQKWERLRTDNHEAAFCEAAVRRLLQIHGSTVEPNEDVTGQTPTGFEARPDFRCSRSENAFFVEVTCISIATVVEQTRLPHASQSGFLFYGSLNDAILKKSIDKFKQYSGADLPTLLAVGTFHQVSVIVLSRKFADMLLTGKTSLSFLVDTQAGRAIGNAIQITNGYAAPFLAPGSLAEVRTSLSGLLLCGFGCDPPYDPPHVRGILHPFAARPFDRTLLPDIHFGEVQVDRATGQLCTSWPTDPTIDESIADDDDLLP